ncbi:MAG: Gfo/Idh/MocA family oxidoreductase, partial [Candidatus Babeliales bacterium]
FLISCSYGPGRYDTTYEKDGIDYPYAYVRWTEQRNMSCFVQMIEQKQIDVSPLIDHEFAIEDAHKAYAELKNPTNLGIVLAYRGSVDFLATNQPDRLPREGGDPDKLKTKVQDESLDPVLQRNDKNGALKSQPSLILFKKNLEKINAACIGAGGFAKTKLLPMLAERNDTFIHTIVDTDATTQLNVGPLYKAHTTTNDYTVALADPSIDAVIIATPHHLHTQQAIDSLTAGKAVFVEKPAAVSFHQLEQLSTFLSTHAHPLFCVDFNRPFSPFVQKIERTLAQRSGPLLITYRMNVGYLDPAHWIQSKANGGRIIGESCHIFDLFLCLTQSTPRSISVQAISPQSTNFVVTDNVIATIHMSDGSLCSLVYTALGNTTAGKESMEIHFDGKTIIMDDFIALTGYGLPKTFTEASRKQDKGHQALLNQFFNAIKHESPSPVPLDRILNATDISLIVDNLARKGGGCSTYHTNNSTHNCSFNSD